MTVDVLNIFSGMSKINRRIYAKTLYLCGFGRFYFRDRLTLTIQKHKSERTNRLKI